MVRILLVSLMVGACVVSGATAPADTVRVYAIEPAYFDYVFTAIVSSSSTNPVLSFNHRSGRTFFVHPGDLVGDYRVREFRPVTTRVFNSTINLHQEFKGGSVILQATNGPEVVLEMTKRLPQPGWMAYLANLADGNWWYVKEGDVIVSAGTPMQLGAVNSNSVLLITAGATNQVPLISDDESKSLATLWASRARHPGGGVEAEEAADDPHDWISEPVARPLSRESPFPMPARTLTVRYPSRTYFGTDYSCPTEYLVLPAIWSPSGRIIRPTMIVPRHFETRSTGFSIETHR